jgi:hypothetical protein
MFAFVATLECAMHKNYIAMCDWYHDLINVQFTKKKKTKLSLFFRLFISASRIPALSCISLIEGSKPAFLHPLSRDVYPRAPENNGDRSRRVRGMGVGVVPCVHTKHWLTYSLSWQYMSIKDNRYVRNKRVQLIMYQIRLPGRIKF